VVFFFICKELIFLLFLILVPDDDFKRNQNIWHIFDIKQGIV